MTDSYLRGLGLLLVAAALVLLRFPEMLLDPPSYAGAPVRGGLTLLLLASGAVLVVLARRLDGGRRIATAAGVCWGAGALGVAWDGTAVSWISYAAAAIAAPALLAVWTVIIVRAAARGRVLGLLGAVGLLLVAARSAVWALNALLPPDRGFYLTSAILTVAALLAFPLWAAWLMRGKLLAWVLAPVLVAVSIGLAPAPRGQGAPAVPSAVGSLFYLMTMAVPGLVPMPADLTELAADRRRDQVTPPDLPPGTTMWKADADGVPAERICARGATTRQMILYLPGGGFIEPAGNGPRHFAAALSRETAACVLLAHYRLAPEHPYPAALQDSVRAYHWLLRQGAARLAVVGDSAGGNLTLATALSLRGSGTAQPSALVSVSGITDLSMTGPTFRTLTDRDPVLTPGTRKLTFDSYTRGGTADLRDPLLSPLHADLTGLPPTLLMAGSQEVLLSDTTRLGDRLRQAGVPGETQVWPGMVHAWPLVVEEAPESGMAIGQIAGFVSRSWSAVR
ncbi:alpha/beta hydrolase [Nonomuraea typhae]|uniref:alpha/beta hydrolase n=1 Tax=Nonomuraea typhae TaxID=2603600 RepID=UPI0012F743B3|nr:alpha/beta hydrolase [Nonomuraea typhae]